MSSNEKSKKFKSLIKNDTFTSRQKREWTYEKLKSNPPLFGGDIGNPAIIKEYLEEVHNIQGLTFEMVSESVGVSRHKNYILKKYEYLDHRIEYAINRDEDTQPLPYFIIEKEKKNEL